MRSLLEAWLGTEKRLFMRPVADSRRTSGTLVPGTEGALVDGRPQMAVIVTIGTRAILFGGVLGRLVGLSLKRLQGIFG
jgi:mannitol-specific phosphotransferase system IIBC component